MGVEFVVDTKDRCCQQKKLGDHGAVACGDLMGFGDYQANERKADGSNEAADCYGVLYGAGAGHGGLLYSAKRTYEPYCSPFMYNHQ